MQHVTYDLSHVTCHMSYVMCHRHRSHFFLLTKLRSLLAEGLLSTGPTPSSCFLCVFFGLSGGASRWRVCYQLGLHRLVLVSNNWFTCMYVCCSFYYYVYLPTPLLKNVNVEEGGPQPYWFFAAVFSLQEMFCVFVSHQVLSHHRQCQTLGMGRCMTKWR